MSAADLGRPLPELLILDLDHTLWPLNVHEDARGAFSPGARRGVARCAWRRDGAGRELELFDDVPPALDALSAAGVTLAVASHTPDRAHALAALRCALRGEPAAAFALWDEQPALFACRPARASRDGVKTEHLEGVLRAAATSARQAVFLDDQAANVKAAMDASGGGKKK